MRFNYEKNYLLSHSPIDLQVNRHQIELGLETLQQFDSEKKVLKIGGYQTLMQQFADSSGPVRGGQEEQIREQVKKLIDLSRQLVI